MQTLPRSARGPGVPPGPEGGEPPVRPYEVMVIFDTGTEPPVIQQVVDRAVEMVRASGGNPGAVERWGRRAFAYEVNHKREGYYVVIEFAAEPTALPELDRMLLLADEVIRHKVVRLPDGAPRRAAPAAGPGEKPPARVAG